MAFLEVQNLIKSFGKTEVLKGVSFTLEEGEVLSIIGPSGNGKTTLLRCLNYLEFIDGGVVKLNDIVIQDENVKTLKEDEIRNQRLHFGMVFQSFNLFPLWKKNALKKGKKRYIASLPKRWRKTCLKG